MTKKTILTLTADQPELFKTVKEVGPASAGNIGERLLGALMTGEMSAIEAVGLGFYGIVVESVEVKSQ